MPRKSLALFLATTGLLTSLAGCGPGKEADEQGGDGARTAPSGQPAPSSSGSAGEEEGGEGEASDNGDKTRKGHQERGDDEGGEGGEGGEG